MRRSYVISDYFYNLVYKIRRNRVAVIVYALSCAVFLVIGIAVGVKIAEKSDYFLQNRAPIFIYLRGESGGATFFFIDMLLSLLYAVFCAALFFTKATAVLSFAPCLYKSYALGLHVSVIIGVFSVPALPMLFIFFVPITLIQICIYCILSYRCLAFSALCGRCMPSKPDIKVYAKSCIPFLLVVAVGSLLKVIAVAFFGSALIGVV
ncbi:MAG: hypothetical protein J1G04_00645 [Clostridiales bacterium]|nr:hypothetical protein [Clostridiales bacterium]